MIFLLHCLGKNVSGIDPLTQLHFYCAAVGMIWWSLCTNIRLLDVQELIL